MPNRGMSKGVKSRGSQQRRGNGGAHRSASCLRQSLFLLASLLCVSACTPTRGGNAFLHPVAHTRLEHYGDGDYGGSQIRMRADVHRGEYITSSARLSFGVTEETHVWVELPVLTWDDRGNQDWDVSETGDTAFGLTQRLAGIQQAVEGGSLMPALAFHVAGVAPHGGRKPARLPGLIEGEETYYALLSAEWALRGFRGRSLTLSTNLGGGLGGHPSRVSRGGRAIGGVVLTHSLGVPGFGLSTEEMKLGLETHWVLDPPGGREFGEFSVGLGVPLGTYELNFGVRFGLTDETEDRLYYIGFGSQLFDAFL